MSELPEAPLIPPIRPGVEPYYTQEDVQQLQNAWAEYDKTLREEISKLRRQLDNA